MKNKVTKQVCLNQNVWRKAYIFVITVFVVKET